MPYIEDKKIRRKLDTIVQLNINILQPTGCLNYFLARLFKTWTQGNLMSYNRAKEFIGELECAKLEVYRRWIIPYEDKKKKENGDV